MIELIRLSEGSSTVGQLSVGGVVLAALELPNKGNQKYISSIPEGVYKTTKEVHARLGKVIRLHGVPNRSGILIHSANYVNQLQGCIAVGLRFSDLNNDGTIDISSSRVAMDKLYESVPQNSSIEIKKKA